MDSRSIIGRRVSHQLLKEPGTTAHDVVAYMGAMQAQDYYGALWSIGLRTGLSEAEVIAAVEKREIVRTWPQRGTLHYVASEDVGWMTALSAPRLVLGAKRRHEDLGLSEAILVRAKELFGQALEGGKTFTRPQMLELLEADGISTQGGRGYHILWFAAQTGQLYVGPMLAKQQTFGLVQDLPVSQRHMSREESVVELAKRYFTARGPATVQDFMWWSGLTAVEAKAGLAANSASLRSENYNGRDYWFAIGTQTPSEIPRGMLLAGFDEYVLGYKDRSLHIADEHFERVLPGRNGVFMPTIVVDGHVVGLWKRTIKKARVELVLEYLESADKSAEAAVTAAAEHYADFLGLPALITKKEKLDA